MPAGNPNFSDAVVAAFGALELRMTDEPGFALGGSQPMAIYCDVLVVDTADSFVAHQNSLLNFGVLGGNRMYASIGQAQKNIQGTAPIEAGKEYTLVLNYDGSTLSIYVDGVLDASGGGWGGGSNNDSMQFGVDAATSYPSPSLAISRLGMWKRALTAAEIGVTG